MSHHCARTQIKAVSRHIGTDPEACGEINVSGMRHAQVEDPQVATQGKPLGCYCRPPSVRPYPTDESAQQAESSARARFNSIR